MRKISSAFFNLTNACNLACRYCFVEQHPDFMTYETAQYAADWLAGNAEGGDVPSINFFGGEPLLQWDKIIKPLTEYIRGKYGDRYELSMTSNCVLMTEDKARFCRDNRIGLLFSVDGDKTTQDRNRPCRDGRSSFDILKPKMPLILKYWPNVTFRSTTTPETCEELFHNMMFAESQGFKSYFVIPNCFEAWSAEEVDKLREGMRRYAEHYIDCLRDGREPILFGEVERMFGKILLHNRAVKAGDMRVASLCKACGKCGLGASRFAGVNINGDIVACQEFFSRSDDKFVIGNIYTGVDDGARQRLIDEWDSTPAAGDDCERCPLNRICDGGCVANNYMASGDMHRVPDIQCVWFRILFDTAVTIMDTLGREENEMFRGRWKANVGRG